MVRARPLVPVKGNLNDSAFNDIIDNSVLPTWWQLGRPFPVSAWQCSCAQREVIQKWFVEIGVEELDWPAQRPDPNPIENQCSPINTNTNAPMFQHLVKAFPEEWRLLQQQRGDQHHINAHDFGRAGGTCCVPHHLLISCSCPAQVHLVQCSVPTSTGSNPLNSSHTLVWYSDHVSVSNTKAWCLARKHMAFVKGRRGRQKAWWCASKIHSIPYLVHYPWPGPTI